MMSSKAATAVILFGLGLAALSMILIFERVDQQNQNQRLRHRVAELEQEITVKNQPKSSGRWESNVTSDNAGDYYRGSIPPPQETQAPSSVESGSSDSAVDVVKQFFQACVDHDYNKAKSYWCEDVSEVQLSPIDRMTLDQWISTLMITDQSDINGLIFTLTNPNGAVKVSPPKGQRTKHFSMAIEFQLVKDDYEWKILGSRFLDS